jgi:dienelactone hydrolase
MCCWSWSTLVVAAWAGLTAAAEPKEPIPYSTAHEAPLKATEEVVKSETFYKQLRVEFNGIKGDRVPGFLYLPTRDKGKRPAVLMQYGIGDNKTASYIVNLGRQFVANGYVVLTIDVPERGERANGAKKLNFLLDQKKAHDLFLQYLGDYSRSVDYLLTRPEVDADRIGYLGISWGAITGLTFVAHEPRVKTMVSMVGGGGLLDLVGAGISEQMKDKVKQVDPVYHIAGIAPRPLLLMNVTKDQLVPPKAAEALHKAAGKGAKVVWKETDHYFRGIDRVKLGDEVIRFMTDNLPTK